MDCLFQFQVTNFGGNIPSPIDKTSTEWWWTTGSRSARDWADSGISDILTLPLWPGENLGNNYDTQREYGWTSRPGSREDLHRMAAICKANSLGLHTDAVLAHRDGWRKPPKSASGTTMRFPKDEHCFYPGVPKDHIAFPNEDYAPFFGSEVSYFSGYYGDGKGPNAPGYMLRNMVRALKDLRDGLDLDGMRVDNIKSLDPSAVAELMKQTRLWGVGECWTSNLNDLLWLIFGTNIAGHLSLFDFPWVFEIHNACNNSGRYDVRNIQRTGLWQQAPFNAVTFVNSHDMDGKGNRVVYNMLWGYALILTSPGLPCIYARDWFDGFGYGLDDKLRTLLWFRRMCAQGPLWWQYTDRNVLTYIRAGNGTAPGALVALNNNAWADAPVPPIWTPWPNRWLWEYSGKGRALRTNKDGYAEIGYIPKNDDGTGYLLFAPDGIQGRKIPVNPQRTTQRFEGADDLDLLPASADGSPVMRIWCESASAIALKKPVGDGVRFSIKDPDGVVVCEKEQWSGVTRQKGWHSITAFSPTATPLGYVLDVNYQAPRGL